MQSGREACVELLVSRDIADAYERAKNIDQYNNRMGADKRITEEANAILSNRQEKDADKKSIVIFNKDWHKGIICIVASRLTELYYKPSVVLTLANGLATGSSCPFRGSTYTKPLTRPATFWRISGGIPMPWGFRSRKRISRSSHAGSRNMYRPISSPHS